MKLKKRDIKNIGLFGACVSFFEPASFVNVTLIHLSCQLITLAAMLFILFQYVSGRSKKVSKLSIYTIFYGLTLLLASFINDNVNANILRVVFSIIAIALMFDMYGFNTMRSVLLNVLFALLTCNVLCYIVFGSNNGFLTGNNAQIIYIFPATCVSIASIEVNEQRKKAIIVLLCSVLTAIMSETATSIFALIVLIAAWRLSKKNKFMNLSLNFVILFIVCCFFIVVVFQVHDKLFVVKFIVEDLLKRDISFTSRTFLWRSAMEKIKLSPIIGYGFEHKFYVKVTHVGFYAVHAHNHFLEQMMQGGVVQLIFFLGMLSQLFKKIRSLPRKYNSWMMWIILMLGSIFLVETYTNAMFYSIFFLLHSYCNYFHSTKKLEGSNARFEA